MVVKIHPLASMDKSTNMYGFTRCPECGSHYRVVLAKDPETVICDECDHEEPRSEDNCSY